MHTNNKSIQNSSISDQEEYQVIKKDLLKVLALNALYLTAVLVLYFTNKETHYLDKWFANILHF